MAISTIYSEQGTVHSCIEVVQKRHLRMMRFGKRGGWQGAIDEARPDRPVFPYQRAFRAIVHSFPEVNSFLSIGVGTGTALNSVLSHHPTAQLHGVEIDQTVLDVAIHYFQAPNHHQADYWVGDGFAFIRAELPLQYQLIFVDAYMRNDIYQPALHADILEALKSRLMDGGLIVYNLIGQDMHRGVRGKFLQAAKSRFRTILDLPVGMPLSDQNHLVMLSDDEELYRQLKIQLGQAPALSSFERVSWPLRLREL